MTTVRVSPSWLALREPADAAARAGDLVTAVRRSLPSRRPVVVHDLACGTGSMLRWLAPRLPGPQHWFCYDLDADLLDAAAAEDQRDADGIPVRVDVRRRDVTRLTPGDLAGATLITASALLDLLTAAELDRLVATVTSAGCPALLTLSVTGRVVLAPAEPLDAVVGAAFNAHQRRTDYGRRLLGPDAAGYLVRALRRAGFRVAVRSTPWRLGQASAELIAAWFTGWLGAAREERPELAEASSGYAARRVADAAAGRLQVLVDHLDVLAVPRTEGRNR